MRQRKYFQVGLRAVRIYEKLGGELIQLCCSVLLVPHGMTTFAHVDANDATRYKKM